MSQASRSNSGDAALVTPRDASINQLLGSADISNKYDWWSFYLIWWSRKCEQDAWVISCQTVHYLAAIRIKCHTQYISAKSYSKSSMQVSWNPAFKMIESLIQGRLNLMIHLKMNSCYNYLGICSLSKNDDSESVITLPRCANQFTDSYKMLD